MLVALKRGHLRELESPAAQKPRKLYGQCSNLGFRTAYLKPPNFPEVSNRFQINCAPLKVMFMSGIFSTKLKAGQYLKPWTCCVIAHGDDDHIGCD